MAVSLSNDPQVFTHFRWADYEPAARQALEQPVTAENVDGWLKDWTQISRTIGEHYNRLYVALTGNTADAEIEKRYNDFMDEVFPQAQAWEQTMKEKLLQSGLEPEGFEIALRNMRAEAELFRQENVPLLSEEQKTGNEYDKIVGAQTVEWEGEEVTVTQLRPVFLDPDRSKREAAWRLTAERQLADREAINAVWQKLFALRQKLAANAGRPDYRSFRWQQLLRFSYTPADTVTFQNAIEEAVVPAASRIYEKRRQRLGVDSLRPWDLDVDPTNRPPLRPFQEVDELRAGVLSIFQQVDPQLGSYFKTMMDQNLLDLENRKNKAPGAYCITFPAANRPFIFANSVGLHDDVQTVLHEGGHSFHVFEMVPLRYEQQTQIPMEFAEVASMGMELLSSPYLTKGAGGFYSPQDAARARIEHLEGSILFWPYMAVVDAFQHWAYTHPEMATDPANCDRAWGDLWDRFMPGVDWSGLEDVKVTGWHRKLHIYSYPFYYVEYGLAQLGAVQVWRNALQDQSGAVRSYRQALALGATASLPELFEKAGARLAFDAKTLGEAVALMESTVQELEVFSQ